MLLYLRAICHVLLWVLLIIKFPTFISLCKLELFLTNLLITNYHLSQASKPNSATSLLNLQVLSDLWQHSFNLKTDINTTAFPATKF